VTTYRCPTCGSRFVGPGDGRPWPCPGCRAESSTPARPPDPVRDRVVELLAAWLRKVDAGGLERQAQAQEPLIAHMVEGIPSWQIDTARGYLGRTRSTEYLRRLDEAECEAIVDGLLTAAPEQGAVLWRYPEWTRRELLVARDKLLS